MPRVELITVGDELLSGLVLNSNVARVADAIGTIGLSLSMVCDVRDDIDEIVAALTAACARADVVLCSGGLGPTSDDLTRDAIAVAAGVELRRDPTLVELVTARYAEWKLPVPDLALRQADLPLGANAVPNPRGSAPGLRLRLGDALVYAVPGVPGELSAMLAEHVVPELAASVGGPSVATRTIRVALTGESLIAAALAGVEAAGEVRVAYLARPGDVSVRFAGAATAMATALERSRLELGNSIYSDDGRTLAEVVHDLLRSVGGSVAVAESLTGGMLAAALTDPPGASTTFRGGEVVYATAAKARLGVDEGLLAARGPVDAEVASQLAARVRERFGTSHALATTGVAGPDPVGPYRPGVVFVALDSASGSRVVRLDLPPRRDLVRQLSVVHALDLLRRELLGAAPDSGNR